MKHYGAAWLCTCGTNAFWNFQKLSTHRATCVVGTLKPVDTSILTLPTLEDMAADGIPFPYQCQRRPMLVAPATQADGTLRVGNPDPAAAASSRVFFLCGGVK